MNQTPDNVQAWLSSAPRNCHTCAHYLGDACQMHKAKPPAEFAEADDNGCDKWGLGYERIPF
jgi:hypothetical protein